MEQNKELARGHLKTAQAKTKSNQLWLNIERELNLLGPPTRDVEGWKKVWSSYKDYIRKKIRRNKQSMSGTGGGPSKAIALTLNEEKVSELLQMERALSGITTAKSFGANNTPASCHVEENPVISDIEFNEIETITVVSENFLEAEPASQSNPPTYTPTSFRTPRARRLQKENKNDLIQKQIDSQTQFHKDVIEKLGDIKRYMKDVHRTEEKKLKAQEEYLKILKSQNAENNKIAYQKLEIKKRLVEIKELKLQQQ